LDRFLYLNSTVDVEISSPRDSPVKKAVEDRRTGIMNGSEEGEGEKGAVKNLIAGG